MTGPAAPAHLPYQTNHINGGVQYRYGFENGYGASVVRHSFSYGNESGLWELAVVTDGDRLCYDTPITDDVLGRLDDTEVTETLDRIRALPARKS